MSLDVFAMAQQLRGECARCGRKAIDLCSCPCRQVFYCDVRCQQEHWPVHKAGCTKARRGRQPQSFCSYCGVASVSLKSCMCEAALYCSFDCQRKHYGVHGRTCSAAVPRFRKRRAKPTTLDGVVGGGDDAAAVAANKDGAGGGQANGGQGVDADGNAVVTAETEIQTDVSCEGLLISIKAALAPAAGGGGGSVAGGDHPSEGTASFTSPRHGGGSSAGVVGDLSVGSGLEDALGGGAGSNSGGGGGGGEMAFRSKASRTFNPPGADDPDTDGDSSDAPSKRSKQQGGGGKSNPLAGP